MFGDMPKPHEVVLRNIVGLFIDVFLVIFFVIVIFIIIPESSRSLPPGAGA
jgi:hypothetical protein